MMPFRCSSRAMLPAWVLLLAVLSGCDDSPRPAQDAGVQLPEDAGTLPWDGGYTVLEERGDNADDPGVLAPCTFLPPVGTSPGTCPEPSQFDLSACNVDSLGNVPGDGIYQVRVRQEVALQDGGTGGVLYHLYTQLRSDGGPSTLDGTPLTSVEKDAQRLFLDMALLRPDGGSNRYALAGCESPEPGRFTGCFARCVNGQVRASATFEAHRMTWEGREPESSGGLQRISESYVAQGMPVDVYVAKEHAYVVSINFYNRPGKAGGLSVFDVKDRRNPVLKKVISLPTDHFWNGVWSKGNALYVASADSGVIVFDISNPADPVLLRSVPGGPPLNVHTVLVEGDRLYGMSFSPTGETLVFDVSNPLEPVLRQRIHFPASTLGDVPHDAFAYGGRLYLNHTTGGYFVVDVSNLDDVKLLGTYPYANGYSHHNAVGTFAGRTLAFEGSEGPGSHLRVLDVTDPAHIVKIGEFQLRSAPMPSIHNMLLVGQRLYVAWYQEGVRVLDVSNPTQPRQVAHYNTFRETDPERSDDMFEGAVGIRVPGDGYVYVVDTSRGLLIFNALE
ncbi:LVIVD repeat-containing protein [Pyxidicoccus sp. 3LG]